MTSPDPHQLTTDELMTGLDHVLAAPCDVGTVELIVARPDVDQRAVLDTAEVVIGKGLVGDNYIERGNSKTPDGAAHPEAQLNLMSARAIDLVAAGDKVRWPLAGDQLFVDLLLSDDNTPVGTRLAIGSAILEIPAKPHTGCAKFAERFGIDAARWVNHRSDIKLRGVNAIVVQSGTFRTGDTITKIESDVADDPTD